MTIPPDPNAAGPHLYDVLLRKEDGSCKRRTVLAWSASDAVYQATPPVEGKCEVMHVGPHIDLTQERCVPLRFPNLDGSFGPKEPHDASC